MDDYIWTRYNLLIIAVFNMINLDYQKEKKDQYEQAQIELRGIYNYLKEGRKIIETNYDKD